MPWFRKNRMELLINPTIEQIYNREPLLKFSFYLSDKNNLLLSLGDEIAEAINDGFTPKEGTIHCGIIGEASSMMWFWTLGAYEVIRTICAANDCFSECFINKLKPLKNKLAEARMPSSKMESKGKPKPVCSDRSADGWNFKSKDLLVGDPLKPLSAKELLLLYDELMSSLETKDVLKRHEDSKQYSSNSNI